MKYAPMQQTDATHQHVIKGALNSTPCCNTAKDTDSCFFCCQVPAAKGVFPSSKWN